MNLAWVNITLSFQKKMQYLPWLRGLFMDGKNS